MSSFDFHIESGIRLDLNGDNGSLELWQGFDQLMEYVEEIRMDESHRVEISSSDEKQSLILSPNVRNGLSTWLRQVSIGLKRAIRVTDRFTIGHSLRCEFVDNENSEIVFCVENNKLQEWVDGKLEVPHIEKLILSRSNNPSIHDGEEEIPIGSLEQRDRVASWLRTTSRVSFEIEDVEMDVDERDGRGGGREEEEDEDEEDEDEDEEEEDEEEDDDDEEEEEGRDVEEKEEEEQQSENVENIETASNTQQEQQSEKVESETLKHRVAHNNNNNNNNNNDR